MAARRGAALTVHFVVSMVRPKWAVRCALHTSPPSPPSSPPPPPPSTTLLLLFSSSPPSVDGRARARFSPSPLPPRFSPLALRHVRLLFSSLHTPPHSSTLSPPPPPYLPRGPSLATTTSAAAPILPFLTPPLPPLPQEFTSAPSNVAVPLAQQAQRSVLAPPQPHMGRVDISQTHPVDAVRFPVDSHRFLPLSPLSACIWPR